LVLNKAKAPQKRPRRIGFAVFASVLPIWVVIGVQQSAPENRPRFGFSGLSRRRGDRPSWPVALKFCVYTLSLAWPGFR